MATTTTEQPLPFTAKIWRGLFWRSRKLNNLPGAVWRKSSRSNDQGLCVEVANNVVESAGVVVIRDSKDLSGPVLAVSPGGWSAFVGGIKTGGFALTA